MGKKKKIIFVFLPLFLILSIFVIKFWAQQECTEYTTLFTENFDNANYKDTTYSSVSYWPPGPVTLSWLGGELSISEPKGMGAKIYVCDKGDFDGDGLVDLIGYDISQSVGRKNELLLVKNYWNDSDFDGVDDNGIIFSVDRPETYDWDLEGSVASISVGDYNNDGLLDFFFCKNRRDDAVYDGFLAAMYINTGTATAPDFNRYTAAPNLNFTTKFKNAGIYIRWTGMHLHSVDIDKDGDTDILFISENKIFLVRNPGPTNFTLDNFTVSELSYDQRPDFPTGALMGGTAIETADFDRDGDLDIVVGSVEWVDHLVYYSNDGTGNFTRYFIPFPTTPVDYSICIGTTALAAEDFDNDGRIDIMASNDRWRSGNLARLYSFRNMGNNEGGGIPVNFEFKCYNNCDPINPSAYDTDYMVAVDYDGDGDIDVITADANDSGDYFINTNKLANVYTLFGEARSTNLMADLDESLYAVTKAKIKTLVQGTRGSSKAGLEITYYLSNNGMDWEFFATYQGSDIHNYSDLPVHTFKNFGSKLFWKAVMNAPEDPMPDHTGASYDTPTIGQLEFEFIHVERKEYSRTSVVATSVVDGSGMKKLIIGASFIYPSWQGQLRAYDLTNLAPSETSSSVIKIVTQPDLGSPSGREIAEGADMFWDAGELLASRASSDRTIYTAVPEDSTLTRLPFDTTAEHLAILGPLLADVNGDNEGLINFIRGEGRNWKLGDINHSNPIVISPPDGAPLLKGDGYLEFMNTWKDRAKVLYVGANDGMLHCFDVLTGQERWAFIPYNLLPKLKNMWAVEPATGIRYFLRDDYVDGTPVIEDVYIDADGNGSKEWITILICGQARGKGSTIGGGLNYYFALNITDPENPQPLWEFTDNTMGETWSEPAIGRIDKQGGEASGTWVAFVGSGYDNDPNDVVGNTFYAIDLESGTKFWSFSDSGVNTITQHGFTWDIANTFPGSPSIVDTDQDGNTERVYVGDLDGRIWKIDVSAIFTGADSWSAVKLYEDSRNYPILSKPEVWMKPGVVGAAPRIYFGTGGDDIAPSNATYSFIALTDAATPEVEWFIGDAAVLGLPAAKKTGVFEAGEKVWADPQVANYIVYFSTLKGNIESVDPCENVLGIGKLYARYVQAVAGSALGETALTIGSEKKASIELAIKTRAAVTLGERQRTSGGSRKREVYIQEYDSTIQKLEQSIAPTLKIKSYREVKRIIK